MNQVLIQLIYFVTIPLCSWSSESSPFRKAILSPSFSSVREKMTKNACFSSFVGTWVSAATILGFTGNVYHSGLSVIASSVIPWFIGAGLLYLMTDRLYENDVLSIPQLIGKKHDSKFLQTASAIFMICGYIFYLMIQIKGFALRCPAC